jgi:hypothetical protein
MRMASSFVSQGTTRAKAIGAGSSTVSVAALTIGLITVAALIVAMLLSGFPAGRYLQDFSAVLSGAYRIDKGQLPHIDFSVPYGALTLFQGWIALHLDWLAPSFAVFQLVTWLLLIPPTFSLAARQQSPVLAVLLALSVALVALVPFVLEVEPIVEFNYNALYNRSASATLILFLVWIFTAKRNSWQEALVPAYLLALLFGWKISHFAVVLGFSVAAGILSQPTRRVMLRALAILFAFMLVVDLVTAGMIRAYFADILDMARINKGGLIGSMMVIFIKTIPAVGLGCVLALLLLRRKRSHTRTAGARNWTSRLVLLARYHRQPIFILLTLGAVLAAESQGTGNLGLFVASVLIFGPLCFDRRRGMQITLLSAAFVAAASYPLLENVARRGVILVLRYAPEYQRDPALDRMIGRSLVADRVSTLADNYAVSWRGSPQAAQEMSAAIYAFGGGRNNSEPAESVAWARCVVDMADMARGNGMITPETRVATIGFIDPFPRLLGAEPLPQGKLWLDPGRTVKTMSFEEARDYLAPADAVFLHKLPADPKLIGWIEASIMPFIPHEFTLEAQNPCYALWIRSSNKLSQASRPR